MDPVILARIQFAVTIGFHYIFPPLTIGMAWMIFWFMNRYRKTGEEIYGVQARFWLKLFAVSFAVGVATGITMEFQFGTNWAAYSRFVGDIFGAPLAAEGVLAFFLESTFMGVLLFGWHRFSRKTLWFASLMVAVGSTLSAFWIIVANSWMQTPVGYEVIGGKAVLTDFWAAVFNPSTIPRYLHTVDGALITGSFFMLSMSAWLLLKGKHEDFARRAFKTALIAGFVAAMAQLPLGHYHAVQVARTQPEKLAAFEGLFETSANAPLLLVGLPDPDQGKVHGAVTLPGMLSLLISGSTDTVVKGLNDFPREEWPPILPSFFSFHLMFLLGMSFIGLTGLGLFLLWRKQLFSSRWYLTLTFLALPLPTIANQLGWMAAEIGRQPWIVYRVPGMRTAQAISPSVSAGEILASLIMFVMIYSLLFGLWVFLLKKIMIKGPENLAAASANGKEVTP